MKYEWRKSEKELYLPKEVPTLIKVPRHKFFMIRQPDFVNKDVVEKAFEMARKKKPHPLLDEIIFEDIEDGLSVQMLHKGSYDNEPETFHKMKEYIDINKLQIKSKIHREIYLSDVRKVEKDKLKTVLRYMVKEI